MPETKEYLFVYGSLRSDSYSDSHRQLITPEFTHIDRATTAGRLYAIIDYPGMLEAESPQDEVIGEVYAFDGDNALLSTIDDYEGCAPHSPQPHLFSRKRQSAVLDSGTQIEVWVYVYNFPVDDRMRIRSGDFLDPL